MDAMRQACEAMVQCREAGSIGSNAYRAAYGTILAQASRPTPLTPARSRPIWQLPNTLRSNHECTVIDSWVYHLTHQAP
jgi:hypothetical protein